MIPSRRKAAFLFPFIFAVRLGLVIFQFPHNATPARVVSLRFVFESYHKTLK
jgi:hypothetical protein